MDSLEHFIDEAISDFPNGMKSHIHTVVDIALELSEIHGANTNEVYLSAKGHDICRLTPPEKLLELAYDFDLPVCDIEIEIPMLLHVLWGLKYCLNIWSLLMNLFMRLYFGTLRGITS